MRFTCVARVTEDTWTTCAVLDKAGLGLKPGDGLDLSTTLCKDVRSNRLPIVIDNVATDPLYRDHITPKMYGFQSYISIPLYRANGDYFGSLCGLDPLPINISDSKTLATMQLFAELISMQLESEAQFTETHAALLDERQTADLREQFIGVLGHDIRTPLQSILLGAEVLLRQDLPAPTTSMVARMKHSAQRISSLVNDVMDFTRGKMGGGIHVQRMAVHNLGEHLAHSIAELQAAHPSREITMELDIPQTIYCDAGRIVQLVSNLVSNAIVHGAADKPVNIVAESANGTFLVSVANAGDRIPDATLSQLFQPYWRAHGHSTEGLGLGLYIVSEIAKSHQGKLDVVSTERETRFTFTLPVHPVALI